MIFYRFLMFAIVGFGGYLIYRVAVNSWRKSEVEDKLDEIEQDREIHEQIEDVDLEEAEQHKKDIDDFLES